VKDVPREPHKDRSEEAHENAAQFTPEVSTLAKLLDELILRATLHLELVLMHIDHRLDVSLSIKTAVMLWLLVLLSLRIRTVAEHEIIESGLQSDGNVSE